MAYPWLGQSPQQGGGQGGQPQLPPGLALLMQLQQAGMLGGGQPGMPSGQFSNPGMSGYMPHQDTRHQMVYPGPGGGLYGPPRVEPQRPQFDWNNPMASLGQRFMSGPTMDNSGLSSLWSRQIGQTQTDPLSGWSTTTNAAHSPLGGLFGRLFG